MTTTIDVLQLERKERIMGERYYRSDEIGATVTRLRKRAKMTQEELAQRVGVTRNTILNLEKGHHYPKVDLVVMIFHHLGYELTPRARKIEGSINAHEIIYFYDEREE